VGTFGRNYRDRLAKPGVSWLNLAVAALATSPWLWPIRLLPLLCLPARAPKTLVFDPSGAGTVGTERPGSFYYEQGTPVVPPSHFDNKSCQENPARPGVPEKMPGLTRGALSCPRPRASQATPGARTAADRPGRIHDPGPSRLLSPGRVHLRATPSARGSARPMPGETRANRAHTGQTGQTGIHS